MGNALGDPKTWGLDAAACAAFTALLWPRLTNRDSLALAVVDALVAWSGHAMIGGTKANVKQSA